MAVHFRHSDVGQDEVKGLLTAGIQCFSRAGNRGCLIPGRREHRDDNAANARFVVNDKNPAYRLRELTAGRL